MTDTVFLTVEQTIVIHDDQIERYGGDHGIREFSLLESAVMRPQTTFGGVDLYETIYDKAAALMHSLILNHAFVDGNKRSGTTSTIVFLELNRYRLTVNQNGLVSAALNVESKKWSIEDISSWLKKHSIKIKH